jgi:tetratricopeptide (TPR) repeat protein
MRAFRTHYWSISRASALMGIALPWSVILAESKGEIRPPGAIVSSRSLGSPSELTLSELAAYPLEQELLEDCRDRRLDRHNLLEASLIAGNIYSKDELKRSHQQLNQLLLELSATYPDKADNETPLHRRSALLFEEMHRRILTGQYRAECTELPDTLERGDYNCVTATLLYQWICRNHQLPVVAIAVPGHVFCQLSPSGDSAALDVQTTCPDWFRKSPQERASMGDGALPSAAAAPRRTLSDIELLGKVYYNRGVTALERDEFSEARRLLSIARRLDPGDAPAKNNLLAGLNNWALALSDQGQFASAIAKLDECRLCDARFAPLLANELHIHERWARSLCDDGRYGEAITTLEQAAEQRPEQPMFRKGLANIYGLWTASLVKNGKFEDAIVVAKRGFSRLEDRIDTRQTAAISDQVRRLGQANERQEAARVLKEAFAASVN